MPLTLVTGPANSEKAGVVLDAYRAAVPRDPILVVPTRADAEHYRRELAASGTVLGARVERFAGLVAEIARRGDVRGRPLGRIGRERVAGAAIATTRLQALAEPARSPGFARAAVALFGELESGGVEPARLTVALRQWAGDGARRAYADDVAAIYSSYRRALERVGRTDEQLFGRAALDALRLAPGRWGATPVLLYGFDDFTPLELDAIETLARVVDAPVTVSLNYEPGRFAFAGRATTYQTLAPLAAQQRVLAPLDDHYEAAGRRALHHLERSLFEGPGERVAADGAVRLLEGGGERAELELVAAEIAALLRDGYAPRDVAVALRSPGTVAPLIDSVFGGAGVPHALERRVRFADTPLGGGALALLRAALLDGDAGDLVRWLRTPGVVEQPALVDSLERDVRRRALSGGDALARWEADRWALDAVARVREAHARGSHALLERVEAELHGLFVRPRQRAAAALDQLELEDARALAQAQAALGELRELAGGGLAPGPSELLGALAGLELHVGGDDAEAVLVTDALALRARRVRALAVCRLQEGLFPAAHRPEPFFSERERTEIALASGLALARPPDPLSAERYLFYAAVSRPRERLILSWHSADDDGAPALRSLFVDDVCDLFEPQLFERRVRRALGAAGEAPATQGISPRAVAALANEAVLRDLRERPAWSASALETWARCPVRWLVERQLAARDLEPEPAPLVRGGLTHEALRRTLSELAQRTGSARVTAASLPLARELLGEAIAQAAPGFAISTNPERLRAAVREVQLDIERYLDDVADNGSAFEPRQFELAFGGLDEDGEAAPPLPLCGGRLPLRGRIDRVDVDAGGRRAIVYDYKGRNVAKPDDWLEQRVFQLPLYMLAVSELLGLDAVGGFYQPIGPRRPDERRPRGLLVEGVDDELALVGGDRRDAAEVRALLDAAVARALAALDELRAGELESRPHSCGYDGRCVYPSVCRVEAV